LTDLKFLKNLPAVRDQKTALLIYDQILLRNKRLKAWIRRFPAQYGVQSGEKLKELQKFPEHIENVFSILQSQEVQPTQIYVLGGGSVGDFGGFVASVLKRGVPVIQIPSTWLAALDSSHGGKTALNVAGFKNQIGTFHYPKEVWISQEVLENQPPQRLQEAAGEFLKTALLGGPQLIEKLHRWNWVQGQIKWADLKSFIEVKYKVLKKDPFEKKGHRHLLNLGHTLGHAWEAAFQIPHGHAIYYGLLFDMAWSTRLGLLPSRLAQKILNQDPWESLFDLDLDRRLFSLEESELVRYLNQDKKKIQKGIRYIFVRKPGLPEVRTVRIQDILKEYRRQKKLLEDFHENL
jgi:3-dehydroquinate synthase